MFVVISSDMIDLTYFVEVANISNGSLNLRTDVYLSCAFLL